MGEQGAVHPLLLHVQSRISPRLGSERCGAARDVGGAWRAVRVPQCALLQHSHNVCAAVRPTAAHVQVEWESDRKGLPAMTGVVFFGAVFELIGTRC